MGQKTNPNIFQLGKTKNWDSKYIEKKSLDISKYSFKNLELNKFIFKFFEDNKLFVYNCKIYYTENTLTVFVSYFVNFETIKFAQVFNKKKLKTHFKDKKRKFATKKVVFFKKKRLFSIFIKKAMKSKSTILNIKKYTKKKNKSFENTISNFEKASFLKKTKVKTFNSILTDNFLNKLFKNINFFFTNSPKIILNFYQFNTFAKKDFSKNQIKFIQKNLSKLRRFSENSYFKEGVQFIIISLKHHNSADFLATYLSKELQKHKKQHFFLNFIQKTLQVFNKKEFCTPKSIKIQIKGRFNGVPRSKRRILQIGNPMSVIKLNTKIQYSQQTSFSANGTFGIKVWISEIIDIEKTKNDKRTQKA